MPLNPFVLQAVELCRSSFLSLRRIGSIHHYLTENATAYVVNYVVSSCFDLCNSTLTTVSILFNWVNFKELKTVPPVLFLKKALAH